MFKSRRTSLIALLSLSAACGGDGGAGVAEDTSEADAGGDAGGSGDTADVEAPDTDPGRDIGVNDTASDPGLDIVPDVEAELPPADVGSETGAAFCGNGIRETGEICDGEDILEGVDCAAQGFLGGVLLCSSTCTLDASGCYDALCGDGVVSGTEECDGAVEDTCVSLGFAPGGAGEVVCTDACAFDSSACQESICGNGNVESVAEECDGEEFGGDSCRGRGFFDGPLVCSVDCTSIDESGCVESVCGNRTIEGDEVCDGTGLTIRTCASFSDAEITYSGGVVGCSPDCAAFDLTGCLTAEIDPAGDSDADSVPDDVDNCPADANPNQLDVDGNGVGNVCDGPIVFADVVEREGVNTLVTTTSADSFVPVTYPLNRVVVAGRAEVRFDDLGGLTATLTDVQFADSTEVVPIPGGEAFGLTSITVTISDATMTMADGDTFSAADTADGYSSGEMVGANTPFSARFLASGSDGTTASDVDVTAELDPTSSEYSVFFNEFRVSFNDPDVALGSVSFTVLGLLPADVAITGLAGTLALTIDP